MNTHLLHRQNLPDRKIVEIQDVGKGGVEFKGGGRHD